MPVVLGNISDLNKGPPLTRETSTEPEYDVMKKNKAGEESTDGGAALGDLGKTLIRCYLSKDLKEVRERVCGHAEKEQFRQKEGHRKRPRRAVAGVSEEWQGG